MARPGETHSRNKAISNAIGFPLCRSMLLVLLTVFSSTGASCAHSIRNPFARLGPPAPELITPAATLDQIVAAVNQNAARIQSYQTNNASISVPGMLGVPLMSGRLAAERPLRLRLQATAGLMGPVVDLGSNDELFWFWVKQNEPPAVYFARHGEFAGGDAERVLPIRPQWLLDALGFLEFLPTDVHQGPLSLGDDRFEITTVMQGSSGPVTRKTVIDARRAWVMEQHFYDAAGVRLASTTARSHKYYPDAGVSLPQKIDVDLPTAELKLSIDVGDVALNAGGGNPQLWQMPVIDGAPPIDVGSVSLEPQPATAGSQMLRADWASPSVAGGAPPLVSVAAPRVPTLTAPEQAASAGALRPMSVAPQQLGQRALPSGAPSSTLVQPSDPTLQRLPAGGVANRAFLDSSTR